MTTTKVFYIGVKNTMASYDRTHETPSDTFTYGLSHTLDRIAGRFDGEGVVVLDDEASIAIGLPQTVQKEGRCDQSEDRAAIGRLYGTDTGWTCNGLYGWTTHTKRGKPTVHMTTMAWLRESRCPLVCPWPGDTVHTLTMWHDRIGTAWRGAPGAAAAAALHTTLRHRITKAGWCPETVGPTDTSSHVIRGAYELVYSPGDWRGTSVTGGAYAHAYDARRAGLAAMGTVDVSAAPLAYTERVAAFDRRRAGWWLVEMPAWNDPRLPHPGGPGVKEGQLCWVTNPTMQLLDNLAEEGRTGKTYIRAAWTGPAKRLFRGYADKMNKAWLASQERGEPLIADAVKAGVSELHGRMNSQEASPWYYRPDHHHTITARKRAKIWMMADRILTVEKRWPIAIDDDTLWYESTNQDGRQTAPASMVFGTGLGQWQHKATRERRRVNG